MFETYEVVGSINHLYRFMFATKSIDLVFDCGFGRLNSVADKHLYNNHVCCLCSFYFLFLLTYNKFFFILH